MKSQRPVGKKPRPVSASLKFGETGETWGNVRAGDAGLDLDGRFFFEDDPQRRVFQVTRILSDPLDPARRLAFYEAVRRDPWPGEPA